jgi:hypothetical protein
MIYMYIYSIYIHVYHTIVARYKLVNTSIQAIREKIGEGIVFYAVRILSKKGGY